MVTLAGALSAVLLLLIATVTTPVAAWLSDTVQVLDALLPKLVGAQESPVSCVGEVRVNVTVFVDPAVPAVIMAV